jgi:hypothetical protein
MYRRCTGLRNRKSPVSEELGPTNVPARDLAPLLIKNDVPNDLLLLLDAAGTHWCAFCLPRQIIRGPAVIV